MPFVSEMARLVTLIGMTIRFWAGDIGKLRRVRQTGLNLVLNERLCSNLLNHVVLRHIDASATGRGHIAFSSMYSISSVKCDQITITSSFGRPVMDYRLLSDRYT